MWKVYDGLDDDPDFKHWLVNHSIEFVSHSNPLAHTNSIEGTWKLAKETVTVKVSCHFVINLESFPNILTLNLNQKNCFPISCRKKYLGYYLAQFMWHRRCRCNGQDPFEKILSDISTYFDVDKCLAETFNPEATNQRKHQKSLRKGITLVS